jgi:lysophospholipase L1-like esterase
MIRHLLLAVLLIAPPLAKAEEPAKFPFHPNDRVVWLGDSITEQYQYSTYLELYLTTRFPDAHMVFYNAGIGGDTAAGGANRFASHVLAEKPAIVTIDFGMNDGGYGGFDPKRAEQYVRSTEKMLEMAQKSKVRVALISPNAVEVRSRPNLKTYLETQEKFYAPLKELAAKFDVPFVDQYAVTRKVLEKIAADDAKVKPFPDGVHTSPAGGLLMAHTILTGLHAPAEVSNFQVDVAKPSVVVGNCEIDRPEYTADHVSFGRTDKAVPLPVLKEWRDLLPYVDQLKDLNMYGLTVKGLKPGKYELRIDGQPVATYSADDLAAGVNVGNAETGPIYDQGLKVLAAIEAKNDIVHKRFRQVVMFDGRQLPDWLAGPADVVVRKRQDELSKRDEQIAAWQAEVYRAATPRTHHWEIKKAE